MEFLSGSGHREAGVDYQTHSVQLEPMRGQAGKGGHLGEGRRLALATLPSRDFRPIHSCVRCLPRLQLKQGPELTRSGFPFLTPRE